MYFLLFLLWNIAIYFKGRGSGVGIFTGRRYACYAAYARIHTWNRRAFQTGPVPIGAGPFRGCPPMLPRVHPMLPHFLSQISSYLYILSLVLCQNSCMCTNQYSSTLTTGNEFKVHSRKRVIQWSMIHFSPSLAEWADLLQPTPGDPVLNVCPKSSLDSQFLKTSEELATLKEVSKSGLQDNLNGFRSL